MCTATTTAATRPRASQAAASAWTIRCTHGRGCASWGWGAVSAIDLLLTHAPAKGLNDGDDCAHRGFECFNEILDEYQPKWFIHGHIHLNYDAKLPRVCTRGNTTVINATERYVFEIPDPDPAEERKTLWRMLGF